LIADPTLVRKRVDAGVLDGERPGDGLDDRLAGVLILKPVVHLEAWVTVLHEMGHESQDNGPVGGYPRGRHTETLQQGTRSHSQRSAQAAQGLFNAFVKAVRAYEVELKIDGDLQRRFEKMFTAYGSMPVWSATLNKASGA
jgi:hypothetical protein